VVQSVDVVKYTEEEYEKYLTDPVGIYSWLYLLLLFFFFLIECMDSFSYTLSSLDVDQRRDRSIV
jgi:choline-glycine betaine transporter